MTDSDNNSIIRVKRRPRYTSISNAVLNDARLSFGARGLLVYFLSKPDNWEVRFGALLRQSPAKRTALRSLLRELEGFRYLRRRREKAARGRFKWVTEVYEEPYEAGAETQPAQPVEEDSPSAGFPPMDDLPADDPPADDPPAGNLSIKKVLSDERLTHERLKPEKTKATGAAARADSHPAPPAPPAEKVPCPNPFPVDAEMRAWAAAECPLVHLEDATDKFVLQYSPDAVDDPPRYSWALWLTKWKTWMRREQKFENRDRVRGLTGSPPPRASRANGLEAEKEKYRGCPDCNGTGMWYPEGPGRGVARCSHLKVPRETVAQGGV